MKRALLILVAMPACSSTPSANTVDPDAGPEAAAPSLTPTALPVAKSTCPSMSNLDGKVASFAGQDATVWSGDPAKGPGPLLIYYYATGSDPTEPTLSIRKEQIDRITGMGGAVVAQNETTGRGSTTGNAVWFTGDAEIADEIVACAIANQKVDPRLISVAGYSAGAVQTVYMWYARSGYVASVLTYSGGNVAINKAAMQDEAHPPAALVTHGAEGSDVAGADFLLASHLFEDDVIGAGGFAIDCSDGADHTDYQVRTKVAPQAVQFFLDHPYGVRPAPYATLPAGWPSYCTIAQ